MLNVFYLQYQSDTFLALHYQNEWTAYDSFGYSRVDLSYIVKCTLCTDFSPVHELLFQRWDNRNMSIDRFPDVEVVVNNRDMFKQLISGSV